LTFFGILLTFLLGFALLNLISNQFRLIELLGFSFLVGIFSQTILMFFLNILGIEYNLVLIFVISILLLVSICIWHFINRPAVKSGIRINYTIRKLKPESFNFLILFAWGLIIYTLYLISVKSLYWPTAASDSLTSFDLYAKALAHEGKLLNTLIYEKRVGYGAAYPPLYSMALSYAYLLGFETSKIIPVLIFLSFVLSFYCLLVRLNDPTSAALFTFFMLVTPEFLAQSAINTTSVPHAVFSSLSVLCYLEWRREKKIRYLYLSGVLLSAGGFTRSETILYMAPLLFYLLLYSVKQKTYKDFFIYVCISIMPFLTWQFFLKAHGEVMEKFIQVKLLYTPNFDFNQLNEIFSYAYKVITSTDHYGITLFLFLICLALNTLEIIKKRKLLDLIFLIFFVYFGYILLLNQFELKASSYKAIVSHSGKRFFFGIITLMWAYISTNRIINTLFKKVNYLITIPLIKSEDKEPK